MTIFLNDKLRQTFSAWCEQEAKQYEGEDAWLSTALSRVARHVKPKDVEETRTVPFDEPEGGDE